jgi:hypothetical protein
MPFLFTQHRADIDIFPAIFVPAVPQPALSEAEG